MDRSALLMLAVGAIVVAGLAAVLMTALFSRTHAIGYLRSNAHGYRSTTTGSEHPGSTREHRWSNEAPPASRTEPGQITPVYPANAGTPVGGQP